MNIKKIGFAFASAAMALSLSLTGCSSESATAIVESADAGSSVIAEQPAGPERVDATQFANVVATPGMQIIDVRTPEEFAIGHIEGAVNFNVEGPDFGTQIAGLDPSGTYAVYCQSGNRSVAAVQYMSDQGINGIFELESGISGWEQAGLPVVS
jgi:rhodanese-related sulfurtransferase